MEVIHDCFSVRIPEKLQYEKKQEQEEDHQGLLNPDIDYKMISEQDARDYNQTRDQDGFESFFVKHQVVRNK
jgi:hypothetical protein